MSDHERNQADGLNHRELPRRTQRIGGAVRAAPVGQALNMAEELSQLDNELLIAAVEVPPVERHQPSFKLLVDLTSDWPQVQIEQPIGIRHGLETAPQWQLAVKRGIDVFGASVLLLLTSPLMLLTAAAIAVTSRGPVFYAQDRVGYMGQSFRFLKFRSMCHDADARKEEILNRNEHQSGPIFKIRDDPRVTRVGKVIRKLSIDELPQLFHVLEGTMSLVGPRPPLPHEVATYGSRELLRLTATPGITCIWQVSGRSALDFDTWVSMDIEYIENWSLWLDLKLLALTIPAVLSGRGAY